MLRLFRRKIFYEKYFLIFLLFGSMKNKKSTKFIFWSTKTHIVRDGKCFFFFLLKIIFQNSLALAITTSTITTTHNITAFFYKKNALFSENSFSEKLFLNNYFIFLKTVLFWKKTVLFF